jgi:hypothetical protein
MKYIVESNVFLCLKKNDNDADTIAERMNNKFFVHFDSRYDQKNEN